MGDVRAAWLFAVAFAAALACTSGDGASGDGADAGDDAGPAREASAPEDAAAACDPDADLFVKVSDAAIADGASTTGVCLGCARVRCPAEIAQCTADCPCQSIVRDAVGCYVTTQQLGCAGRLTDYFVTAETRKDALQILGCVRQECPSECGIADAGAPDGA